MSLLTKAKRSEYFQYLNLGEYNKSNILKFQKIAFKDSDEHDGKYGAKTDTALRHWRNTYYYTKSFRPQEFRCPCGHCTGYPSYMKARELKILQQVRDKYDKPVEVTSGLRCSYQNKKAGGISTSRHMEGRASDIYIKGVCDSVGGRKEVINYAKKLTGFRYAYCNGYPNPHPSMGKAIHIDCK